MESQNTDRAISVLYDFLVPDRVLERRRSTVSAAARRVRTDRPYLLQSTWATFIGYLVLTLVRPPRSGETNSGVSNKRQPGGERGLAVPESNSGVSNKRHPGGENGFAVPESNSGVSERGQPCGDRGLAVSVDAERDSGGDLGADSSEGSFNGSIPKPRSATCSSQHFDLLTACPVSGKCVSFYQKRRVITLYR